MPLFRNTFWTNLSCGLMSKLKKSTLTGAARNNSGRICHVMFPGCHVCLDLFHAVQRVTREVSKRQKGSKAACTAFSLCFCGEGRKDHVRSDVSRTAEPNVLWQRVRDWVRNYRAHANVAVRQAIADLKEHSECLFEQWFSGSQNDECLHRFLNAATSFRRCTPDYMRGLISCLVHRWNKRKFARAWAKPEAIGITKDYLRDLAPHFARCMDNHCEIPDDWLGVRGVAGDELLGGW